jgi:hypothetical protein
MQPPDLFDLARARQRIVCRAVEADRNFGERVETLMKDKRLLWVPSGALTALPFHLLVTFPRVISSTVENS